MWEQRLFIPTFQCAFTEIFIFQEAYRFPATRTARHQGAARAGQPWREGDPGAKSIARARHVLSGGVPSHSTQTGWAQSHARNKVHRQRQTRQGVKQVQWGSIKGQQEMGQRGDWRKGYEAGPAGSSKRQDWRLAHLRHSSGWDWTLILELAWGSWAHTQGCSALRRCGIFWDLGKKDTDA